MAAHASGTRTRLLSLIPTIRRPTLPQPGDHPRQEIGMKNPSPKRSRNPRSPPRNGRSSERAFMRKGSRSFSENSPPRLSTRSGPTPLREPSKPATRDRSSKRSNSRPSVRRRCAARTSPTPTPSRVRMPCNPSRERSPGRVAGRPSGTKSSTRAARFSRVQATNCPPLMRVRSKTLLRHKGSRSG